MERASVSSSSLASVGYDRSTGTLEVEFREGTVYQYFLVPESVHRALIEADSIGRYFVEHVRNAYPHERL